MVETLAKAGVDSNRANRMGITPLMAALHNPSKESIFKALIAAGASPGLSEATQGDLLLYAIQQGSTLEPLVAELLDAKNSTLKHRTNGGKPHSYMPWIKAIKSWHASC